MIAGISIAVISFFCFSISDYLEWRNNDRAKEVSKGLFFIAFLLLIADMLGLFIHELGITGGL